jgi:hypothetical protein
MVVAGAAAVAVAAGAGAAVVAATGVGGVTVCAVGTAKVLITCRIWGTVSADKTVYIE